MNLNEIEVALHQLCSCPKCADSEGFWLGFRHDHAYVQCKNCGVRFEPFDIVASGSKGKTPRKSLFLKK